MTKFEEMNEYINSILTWLTDNQNLCKLIYYNDINPLRKPDLNDEDRIELTLDKILPLPKIPSDRLVNENSYLLVYLDNIEKGGNIYFKDSLLCFDIICNLNLWRMVGRLRPYAIMHELDEMFNNKSTLGVGKTQFYRSRMVWYSKDFCGYSLQYRICDFS
ncbi:hypothetical protein [Paenibacillus xylaniclasticus]|uniref:hypothetical protein n=1 Tax=Paenibacillus xylaniclasticus TaxID=588083 RepID=UPI000FD8CCD9|nr:MULTISPECIES: hypothetical protein [Paenibacillus]GFN32598.1 hypothetical protein PCURB6_28580 [Paenibacillus curdlanolyticus]